MPTIDAPPALIALITPWKSTCSPPYSMLNSMTWSSMDEEADGRLDACGFGPSELEFDVHAPSNRAARSIDAGTAHRPRDTRALRLPERPASAIRRTLLRAVVRTPVVG